MCVGGTGTGKSTLAEYLGAAFVERYKSQGAWRLILDSKPRYRAQWWLDGTSTKRHYKGWSHGEYVPGSCLITPRTDPDPLKALRSAYILGYRTVIASAEGRAGIPWLQACAGAFIKLSKHNRPQLLQVDETMDFYTANGTPIGGDAIERASRGGRERGTAALYCTQRTYKISTTLLQEMERLYCFRLDYVRDADRFADFGAPPFEPPQDDFDFRYWYKKDKARIWPPMSSPPYRLALAA